MRIFGFFIHSNWVAMEQKTNMQKSICLLLMIPFNKRNGIFSSKTGTKGSEKRK